MTGSGPTLSEVLDWVHFLHCAPSEPGFPEYFLYLFGYRNV